jgi:hypothetical protein
MAFAQIYINRDCPAASFPDLEGAIQPCVGDVVYGARFHSGDAEVSASAAHGTMRRYMELDVRVDTEDLPEPGWLMTDEGLCIPDSLALTDEVVVGEIPAAGLSEKQLYDHHKIQSRLICGRIAVSEIWNEIIGWHNQVPPELKVGALVVKAQGAWHATDTKTEA